MMENTEQMLVLHINKTKENKNKIHPRISLSSSRFIGSVKDKGLGPSKKGSIDLAFLCLRATVTRLTVLEMMDVLVHSDGKMCQRVYAQIVLLVFIGDLRAATTETRPWHGHFSAQDDIFERLFSCFSKLASEVYVLSFAFLNHKFTVVFLIIRNENDKWIKRGDNLWKSKTKFHHVRASHGQLLQTCESVDLFQSVGTKCPRLSVKQHSNTCDRYVCETEKPSKVKDTI